MALNGLYRQGIIIIIIIIIINILSIVIPRYVGSNLAEVDGFFSM